MSNLTYKPVKIEIVYSNSETRKLGINEGDVFEALQEHYKGIPKLNFQFIKDGNNCIAYAVEHDDEPMIMVTTCKIYEGKKMDKQILSDLNRVKAQVKQLNESELFSKEDRDRLNPIYEAQIDKLGTELIKKTWNDNARNLRVEGLGFDEKNQTFNFSDSTIILETNKINTAGADIEVNQPETLSNNQSEE